MFKVSYDYIYDGLSKVTFTLTAPKRPKNEERRNNPPDEEEPAEDRNRKRPSDRKPAKKNNRRPVQDYEEDEIPESDDSHTYEQRPRKKHNDNRDNEGPVSNDGRPIIKPATGTIYDRPRVAPRINLPVPKNAADKYAYKAIGSAKPAATTTTSTTTTTASPVKEEQEYEDEEYEEPAPAKRRPIATVRNRRPEVKREKNKSEETKSPSNVPRSRTRKPEETEETTKTPTKPRFETLRNRYRANMKKPAVVEEEYDEDDYLEETVKKEEKLTSNNDRRTSTTTTSSPTTTTRTTTTTTTTSEASIRKEPIMRIIKRPFLPSRGGSPYNGRGLHPIGLKAADKAVLENDSEESRVEEQEPDYVDEVQSKELEPIREFSKNDDRPKPLFKPSPVIVKVPVRSKYPPSAPELISPESSRQQTYKSSHTTQRPKIVENDPLDLNEYDVTLNEALSPTLPNLPIRAFPTGFGSGGDYGYTAYSRPRYVLEPVLSPTNNNYVNANKRSQQRYEAVPHQVQYTEASRGYRPQQHGQTQAILSGY